MLGNPVPDQEMRLSDGTALTSTGFFQVDAADGLIEGLGGASPDVEVFVNITACDDGNGDETYDLELRGSTDSFGSVDVELGSLTITRGFTGRVKLGVKNVQGTTVYDSVKLRGVLGGTTPSITLKAQLGGTVFYGEL